MASVSCYFGVNGPAPNGGTSVYFSIGGNNDANNVGGNNKQGGMCPGRDGVTSAYFGIGANAPPTSVYFAVN
uniref:Uncharacterized protein n=1 Tax=Panagrolaimus sp. PS1159 TaxID=55785 RepID=A0AC35G9F1_9BILA